MKLWKDKDAPHLWVGYSPDDSFGDVFGVEPDKDWTLLEALKEKGGGEKALVKQATAALLNSTALDYAFSTSQVIAMVQAAYAADDFNPTKDLFEDENKTECPLDPDDDDEEDDD